MDIDLAALRALERERDISLDVLIPAIEQALLLAYHRTEGAYRHRPRRARPQDRARRRVGARGRRRVRRGRAPGGEPGPEFDDTPDGLRPGRGRHRAPGDRAAAARRRGRRDPRRLPGPRGRHRRRRHPAEPATRGRAGRLRHGRGHPPARRAGAGREATRTASGCAATWSRVKRGPRGPQIAPVPHPPQPGRASCSPSRCPRSPTAPSRSRRWPARPGTARRSRCTPPSPGVNAKGACIGPMGARVRAVMSELHGEKIDIVDCVRRPARRSSRHALSPARVSSVEVVDARSPRRRGSSCRTTSCRWPSARRARTPGWPPSSPAGASTSARTPSRGPASPPAPARARGDDGPGAPARTRGTTWCDGRLVRPWTPARPRRCAPASGVEGRMAGRHSLRVVAGPTARTGDPCRPAGPRAPSCRAAARGCTRTSSASTSPSVVGRSRAPCGSAAQLDPGDLAVARLAVPRTAAARAPEPHRRRRTSDRTESGFDADEHPMSTQQ